MPARLSDQGTLQPGRHVRQTLSHQGTRDLQSLGFAGSRRAARRAQFTVATDGG